MLGSDLAAINIMVARCQEQLRRLQMGGLKQFIAENMAYVIIRGFAGKGDIAGDNDKVDLKIESFDRFHQRMSNHILIKGLYGAFIFDAGEMQIRQMQVTYFHNVRSVLVTF